MSLEGYSLSELKEEIFKREFNLASKLKDLIYKWENETLDISDNEYFTILKYISEISNILFEYESTTVQVIKTNDLPTVPCSSLEQEQLLKESSEK